jgi:arginine/ornithine transport system permease protein
MFDWSAIAESLPMYREGLLTTLQLLVLSLVIGLVAALPLAVMRASRRRWLWMPVWAYT